MVLLQLGMKKIFIYLVIQNYGWIVKLDKICDTTIKSIFCIILKPFVGFLTQRLYIKKTNQVNTFNL